MQSDINASIKKELMKARVYTLGRGIRIDVNDANMLKDIKNTYS